MNRDDIIRMAREAGFPERRAFSDLSDLYPRLERFAALVAAAERENMIKEGWRRCAVGQRTTQFCGMLEDAVKAEREACAKIAEPKGPRPCDCTDCYCGNFGDAEEVAQWDADMWIAKAIRERGEK